MSSKNWATREERKKKHWLRMELIRVTFVKAGDVAWLGLASLPPPSGISFDLVDTSDIIKSSNKMAVLLEITIVSMGVSVKILNFCTSLILFAKIITWCLDPPPGNSAW